MTEKWKGFRGYGAQSVQGFSLVYLHTMNKNVFYKQVFLNVYNIAFQNNSCHYILYYNYDDLMIPETQLTDRIGISCIQPSSM